MGPVQIVFILINLSIPAWLYFRSSDAGTNPRISWSRFESNMEKIIEASGGFAPCSTDDVVEYLRDLCEKSMERWSPEETTVVERAAAEVIFSCEVRLDATFVQFQLENSTEDFDLKCGLPASYKHLYPTPAFVFDRKGDWVAIEFYARNRQRQSVPMANCHRKLQLALARAERGQRIRFMRLKGDPPDWAMANRMCFEYGTDEGWKKIRSLVKN